MKSMARMVLTIVMMAVFYGAASAATRNIVPRATGEGGIGTSSKEWATLYVGTATNSGAVYIGADNLVSTFPALGSPTLYGNTTSDDFTSVDDVIVGDDLNVTGLATITETLSVTGNSYLGAANYKSTNTASSGAWAITGAISGLGNLTIKGNVYLGADNYVSTITAASGAQVWTGGLTAPTFNGAVVGGAISGTTGTFSGDVKWGAANFVSTATAASGQLALGGAFLPKSKTLAELDALTGVVGALYRCSDCTSTSMCIGTGTAAGAWVDFSSPTVHCDTKK